jgi:dTDP-4-dehydrorhamnose reductase
MKILILGSSGMLGSYLFKNFKDMGHDVYGVSRSINNSIPQDYFFKIDFTKASYKNDLTHIKIDPDFIINVSGLTSLKSCSDDPDLANFLNARINEDIIDTFSSSRLIYLSTDSVFDGSKGNYLETDKKSPINNYAKSKSLGEDLVLDKHPDSIVLRTNIYGRRLSGIGPSLVDWALEMFKNDTNINGYSDYFFNPLHLGQVAQALNILMLNTTNERLFHIGCDEQISKFDFLEILRTNCSTSKSIISNVCNEIPEDGIPRPKNTILNYNKFRNLFGVNFTLDNGIKKI